MMLAVMYGMMPRKMDLQQCTAAEQVDELVDPARGLTVLQALLDILVVHTGRGDEEAKRKM